MISLRFRERLVYNFRRDDNIARSVKARREYTEHIQSMKLIPEMPDAAYFFYDVFHDSEIRKIKINLRKGTFSLQMCNMSAFNEYASATRKGSDVDDNGLAGKNRVEISDFKTNIQFKGVSNFSYISREPIVGKHLYYVLSLIDRSRGRTRIGIEIASNDRLVIRFEFKNMKVEDISTRLSGVYQLQAEVAARLVFPKQVYNEKHT